MKEEYLRGLNAALNAADAVGPAVLACMATAAIRKLIEAEEARLRPIRREADRLRDALAPRRF